MWERLREPWFWAVIGAACWTVIVATASCILFLIVAGFFQPTTAGDYLAAAYAFLIYAWPLLAFLAMLTAIPWFLLAAGRRGWL